LLGNGKWAKNPETAERMKIERAMVSSGYVNLCVSMRLKDVKGDGGEVSDARDINVHANPFGDTGMYSDGVGTNSRISA
jgi:hypothetical protein